MNKEIKGVNDCVFQIEIDKLKKQIESYKAEHHYKKYLEEKHYTLKTKISYLKDSEALTESDINLFVGKTGIGKTDLVVTQIVELILNEHTIYCFVSEGKVSTYYKQVMNILKIKRKSDVQIESYLSKLIIKGQRELPISDPFKYEIWVNKLIKDVNSYESKVLFFDNISTSPFSWSGPNIESGFISYLSSKIETNKLIGMFYIHTSRDLINYKITSSDVRGNAANMHFVSNAFALNDTKFNGEELRILEVLKCRMNGTLKNSFYLLEHKKLKKRGFFSKSFKISTKQANLYLLHNQKRVLNTPNKAKFK